MIELTVIEQSVREAPAAGVPPGQRIGSRTGALPTAWLRVFDSAALGARKPSV
ncbi:hypothetical protein D3C87_2139040 [compost metagenome]